MRLYRIGLTVFIFFWAVFVLMDYWQKHPMYAVNFVNFPYYDFVAILAVLGVGFGFGVKQLQQRKNWQKAFNGLSLFGITLFIIGLSTQFYLSKNNISKGNGSILYLLGLVSFTSLCTYLVVLCSYVLGELILLRLPIPLEKLSKDIIAIAVGIMGVTGILFVLGALKLLVWYVIVPIFLVVLGLRWRNSLDFLHRSLIKPIRLPKKLNLLGIGSFYILLLGVSWTIQQVCLPFPTGWDALSLYVALPSWLNDYNALMSGFQPYNWSLFMSLGFVIFNKIEVVLMLSYLGGFLSIFALFQLSRTIFNMNINYSLLCVTLFHFLPTVGFQSIHDQKVDLGLLFIMLVIVLLFLHWVILFQEKETDNTSDNTPTYFEAHIAVMGLLTGFAFGIKLTTLFIFFSLLAAIWYVLKGKWGFLAIFVLSIFGILLLRLDEQSGLRAYHLSADLVKWVMLLVGVGLAGWLLMTDKTKVLKGIRLSFVYGCFFILPVLPWLTKNYLETKQLNVVSLLNGKSNAPNGSVAEFKRIWEQSK